MSRFQFVDDHRDTVPVKWLCQMGPSRVNDGRNLVHSRRTETRPRRCIHCAALSAFTDGNVSIPVFLSR